MDYFQLLPKELNNEIEIYKRMSKINDEVLEHFVNLHLDIISEDTDKEKEESVNELNDLFKQLKIKAKMIDKGDHEYSLKINKKQLISNEQTSKIIAFVIRSLSGLDIVIQNENLIEMGSNLRIVLLNPLGDKDRDFDVGIFQSLL